MRRVDARYTPADHEHSLFERWQATGVFAGDPDAGKPSYTIALPPPNVTGELHMGHALNGATQDTLIRLRRMQGFATEWICGTDHASIAVHAVIEKQLRAEGKTRWDLGREAFVERVWAWREATGATIISQFKRLGCTLDYDHERFTMDEGYVRAVLTMFVRLYRKGYIYRGNRLINWCPTCASTISDLEVRYEHAHDTLFDVRYRIKDSDESVTVATVRPETILADTAIAVHPDDPRYTHLVGRTAIVPLVEREVPVIADDYVKMDFGTGVLKITPGHDPNDFEIGRRHGLPEISVIGFDGRMSAEAGEFAGLAVGEARQKVIDRLFSEQLLHGERPYEHEVGHCDRTGDRIEPLISLQWFMRMDELAAPANAAVRSGRVRFHPKTQENTYFSWMDNLRPWCVSRQLWWGHQIPVWYCPDGHATVGLEPPAACAECGKADLERDPDVLDTWFSSALWPFATLGWPDQDPRLDCFYPGDVLSTARDIINLWVARMLMMGIEFMGEIPFTDVLIHSTIQAPDGRRMSKSLGTGIDPLGLVDRYGADATRYGLLKMSSTQDVRFDEGAIREGAALANKLWNASRFVINQPQLAEPRQPGPGSPVEDRWIASRLDQALEDVLRQVDRFDFSAATKTLYSFIWNEFCDWYIELCKPRLYGEDADARGQVLGALRWTLNGILRMAHPIMPFVTEAIWGHLPGGQGLLMLADYPAPDPTLRDPDAMAAMRERSDPEPARRRQAADDGDAPAGDRGAELEHAKSELARAQRMLANAGFTSKAPAEKIAEERAKLEHWEREVKRLSEPTSASDSG
jgi:valyl-tRNA synthetase